MKPNLNVNIPVEQTTPVICESCESQAFVQVVFLRKVSKFLAGTDEDGLIPIPSFACVKCGHVNKEFQPRIDQA